MSRGANLPPQAYPGSKVLPEAALGGADFGLGNGTPRVPNSVIGTNIKHKALNFTMDIPSFT